MSHQSELFAGLNQRRVISTTGEVEDAIAAGSPVAIGVSGGKDSCAVAFAVVEHLNRVGHAGPRLLIHADLGRTEWEDSAPTCARLAARLGLELVTVRRKAGDMLARWETRWAANARRWLALSCVKLILPWSTAAMRFCTSELKTKVICASLRKRFKGHRIVSVTGVRREESTDRRNAPIACVERELTNKTTSGLRWNAIATWTKADVFASLAARSFPLHEAYTRYGASRVSCAFCILASRGDLAAAASCPSNLDIYRAMVELEAASSFAFQGSAKRSLWLGDVAPALLSEGLLARLERGKEGAVRRARAEARLPEHLLYTKGWPTAIPTQDEAELIADVRLEVAKAVGLEPTFTNPADVIARYRELMAAKVTA